MKTINHSNCYCVPVSVRLLPSYIKAESDIFSVIEITSNSIKFFYFKAGWTMGFKNISRNSMPVSFNKSILMYQRTFHVKW
jgi:hypothetical protein